MMRKCARRLTQPPRGDPIVERKTLKNCFFYQIHGFTVLSDIECPELAPGRNDDPDVRVSFGSLSHIPLDEGRQGTNNFIGKDNMLLNIRGVARFSICNGEEIVIDPCPKAEEGLLRLFLLGTAFGCILHQRSLLPLHASAILHNGEAVLFLGHSGVGKSTLAAAMKNRGYKVVADDVCAVKVQQGEEPLVYPGIPQIKLWKETVEFLGGNVNAMKRLFGEEEKYALPAQNLYYDKPLLIKRMYILHAHTGKELSIFDMHPLEKIHAIKNYTYRKGMVVKMGIITRNLNMCGLLARSAPLRMILRPNTGFLLRELTELIENDLQ